MRHRLLVVAQAFPPCGGAGVQRIAKTVKYLSAGWDVTVLTVETDSYGVLDTSHDGEIDASVVRTRFFDPIARATVAAPPAGSLSPVASPRKRSWLLRTLAKRAWTLVDRHLLIPDRFVLWYSRAVRAALELHRRAPFDAILATGDPYSAFLIAMRVSRVVNVPFVIDMRDPWTILPYQLEKKSAVRSAVERSLERRVLQGCAACVFANRSVDSYREAYPQLSAKFHYVPNGYDPADFAGVSPRRFDRFTFVHNGTFLDGYRTADALLHAVAALLSDDPCARQRFQIMLVGKIGGERDITERLGLTDVVHHVGYLPHRESLEYVLGADALLLVGGGYRWEETGKVFEYLAAARPILGIVEPDGAAADLLRRSQCARIVGRQVVPEIRDALRTMIDAIHPVRRPEWLDEYRRDRLAARVDQLLESVVLPRTSVMVSAQAGTAAPPHPGIH